MFNDLKIGDKFIFKSEVSMPYSGIKKGICVKISKRKYVYIEDQMTCQVGSNKCEVINV